MDDLLDEFQGEAEKFDHDFGKDIKRRMAHMLEAYNPIGDGQVSVNELEKGYLGLTLNTQNCSLGESVARDAGKKSGLLGRWAKRPVENILFELPNYMPKERPYNDNGMESVNPVRTEAMIAADKIYDNIVFRESIDNANSVSEIRSLVLASDIYTRLSDDGKKSVTGTMPSDILKEAIGVFKLENGPVYTGKNRLVMEFNEVIKDSLEAPWSEGEIDESLAKTKYMAKDIYDFMNSVAEAYQKPGEAADQNPLTGEALTNIIYFRDSAIENCPENTITLPKVEKSLYNYLGRGLKKSVVVEGDVGDGAGYLMYSGQITIRGSAEKRTGYQMKGGKMLIEGNAEIIEGMEGGEIWVSGDAYVDKTTMRGGKVFKNGKQIYPGWFSRLLKK